MVRHLREQTGNYMKCEYCGEEQTEDMEIITKHTGDESIDICEACLDNME